MRRAWVRSVAAGIVLAAGCAQNPFATSDADYGRRVAMERLRGVQPLDMEEYRAPEPAPAKADPLASARRAAAAQFAGVTEAKLSIEECRASALEHNLDLRVALVNPTIAHERVAEQEGKFEAAFTLRASYRNTDTPTASTLTAAQEKGLFVEPGVRIPLRTGGTATVTLPISSNETNNRFATLNPSYTSDLQFSLSHQLLRGAGRYVTMAQLRIASYNAQASEAGTKLEVIRQVAAADRSYWRLFQARANLDVSQQQYELANAQLDRAGRRVNAGSAPEIEVVRAQAGAAQRLAGILQAQNAVLLQQRELKQIINLPGLEVGTKTVVQLATPPDPVEYVFDRDKLIEQALANRMEMLQLELQLAADAVNQAFARNQTLPLLSLDYTYRVNGLGGSLGQSFRTLKGNNFEDWELGLSGEIPLGNEEARARLRQAILTRLQRLATKASRELAIRREVLDAIDTIEVSWQRVLAARQSVILNTRAVQGEQRLFDVGGNTSTDVLNAATFLAQAQFEEVQALTAYQIAQVDLAFATGTLLGAAKVEWAPAPSPSEKGPDPAE